MKNKENNNTKSLFLYTALIFVVALLLILISFFGDANLEKNITHQNTSQENVTLEFPNKIDERASQLSEENLRLGSENAQLKKENEAFKKQVEAYKSLINAQHLKENGNTDEANAILEKIDPQSLDNDQKELYNKIINE